MATVGDQLVQPEAGWRRYDDSDGRIRFNGTWTKYTDASAYNSTMSYAMKTNDRLSFKFKGTKIRLIIAKNGVNTVGSSNIEVKIDGVSVGSMSCYNPTVLYMILGYEKMGLSDTSHNIEIINNENNYLWIDAIDIDSTGELLSIPPATTGKLCNTLDEMDVGDYIVWKRDGTVHSFGGSIDGFTELSVTGIAPASLPTKHFHYAIKVDTGLLISDRVTEHTISWDTLNASKRIQGLPTIISGVSGVIRSLTGGVAYADENGNKSLSYIGEYGTFPTNNEWDKYILNFPTQLIQSNETLNDVFHGEQLENQPLLSATWCQDTSINGLMSKSNSNVGANTNRIARSWGTHLLSPLAGVLSNVSTRAYGFRPVFFYKEV